MEFGVGLFEEAGDHVGALWAARRGFCHGTWTLLHLRDLRAFSPSLAALVMLSGRDHACGIIADGGLRLRLRRFRLIVLENESCVFLVAFGGKADIVELDLIHPQLGYMFR